MGASASVVVNSKGKKEISAEDTALKQQIIGDKKRLSSEDMKLLCEIEEHHDPTKHLLYTQIFNTLKEWDAEVRQRLSSCGVEDISAHLRLNISHSLYKIKHFSFTVY
jgi:hypothetical protein